MSKRTFKIKTFQVMLLGIAFLRTTTTTTPKTDNAPLNNNKTIAKKIQSTNGTAATIEVEPQLDRLDRAEERSEVKDNVLQDVDEAAAFGFDMLHQLVNVKEPLLYSMGLYLDKNDPASRVAAFSEPNPEVLNLARFGYATIQAKLRLNQKLPEGRTNPEDVPLTRASTFERHCPLKGTPRCPPASRRYRTSDGTCNNLDQPWKGASMLPMQRFLLPVYDDDVQSIRRSLLTRSILPSAREVSVTIHRDKDAEMSSVTMMFMQWGQFVDHDLTSTAQSRAFNSSIPRCCAAGGRGFLPLELTHPECLPIEVPPNDWFLDRQGIRCIEFIRSAPSTRIDCHFGWREQINQVTSYLDGSMIYGSDAVRADSLRLFRNGLMIYGKRRQGNQEPCHLGSISTDCFKGGDGRFGEQPGLTAFHTVFLRFHNRLAAVLSNLNGHWSDEKLYQETRRIIGALVQHITYKEFLPIVLGADVMELFDLNVEKKGYYKNYNPAVNVAPANAFSSAAFRFGHSLVQSSFMRSDSNHHILTNNVSLHEELDNPENIFSIGSLDRLILGFSNQASQRRDEFISRELTNHLFQQPGQRFGMDLAAINVQRGRDHGIPPYVLWREPCGLSSINTWADLEPLFHFETLQRFRAIYEDVADIDLYSGGLAERPVKGGIVGPTFACIIAQQFMNLRQGDRFWYENGEIENSFTPAQLQQIRRSTFSQILCQVLPEIETLQPFVFLTPDNFRNVRLSCNSPQMESLDLRAWEERKRALEPDNKKKATIDDKIDLEGRKTTPKPDIDDKIDLGDKKKKQPVAEHKIDFGVGKPLVGMKPVVQSINDKLEFKKKTTPKNEKLVSTTPSDVLDFDVIFVNGQEDDKHQKSEFKEVQFDELFLKNTTRSKRSNFNDDDPPQESEQTQNSRKRSNKKKRKKKPGNRRNRSTTRKPPLSSGYFDSVPVDFYNPIRIKIGNTTRSTTPRPFSYDNDYVLHPTIDKPNKKPSSSVQSTTLLLPDYQVNINIQYVPQSTPKTEITINGNPVQDDSDIYIPLKTNKPHYDYSQRRPLPVRTTTTPDIDKYIYDRPVVYNRDPTYVLQTSTRRPTYNYDKFEDRPFSTSKRPYIYKPSSSYLSMFEQMHQTTSRPYQPYHDTYKYKQDQPYYQDDDDDEYEDDSDDYERPSYGERNFVKISSVQGNRYLSQMADKEQYIHTAQQRDGASDLGPGDEAILVDVIPRENRREDWVLFEESPENIEFQEPQFRSTNESIQELPKPIVHFWKTRNTSQNTTRHL